MLDWLILFAAIIAEVMAITAMKLTNGFKKIWPWAVVMATGALGQWVLAR